MTNQEIYSTALALQDCFTQDIQLPIKLNFYIHKNLNNLISVAKIIEKEKEKIGLRYGKKEELGYKIEEDKIVIAQHELDELMSIENNDVKISKIKLSELPEDLILTSDQMDALMFMIDDEEKED